MTSRPTWRTSAGYADRTAAGGNPAGVITAITGPTASTGPGAGAIDPGAGAIGPGAGAEAAGAGAEAGADAAVGATDGPSLTYGMAAYRRPGLPARVGRAFFIANV